MQTNFAKKNVCHANKKIWLVCLMLCLDSGYVRARCRELSVLLMFVDVSSCVLIKRSFMKYDLLCVFHKLLMWMCVFELFLLEHVYFNY